MAKFDIKHRWTGAVIFTAELSAEYDGASEAVKLGAAIKIAVKGRADLSRADLSLADLFGANLSGADLSLADLYGADLSRADLFGADLSGAELSRAYLSGANLYGADLYGAYLSGADLFGHKVTGLPLFIRPIGSANGTLEAWPTEDGLYFRRGCFFGTPAEFLSAVEKTHGDNEHGRAYRAAVEFIKTVKGA